MRPGQGQANRKLPSIVTRPLWTCPKCGKEFVNRNSWHACGPYNKETFLEGKAPRARALFERFAELIRSCGPVTETASKTRAEFMVRVRFAGVTALSERGMTCTFWLTKRLDSPRFTRIELIPPNNWIHRFRVTTPEELDDEVLGWLKQAYWVGEQRHLMSE